MSIGMVISMTLNDLERPQCDIISLFYSICRVFADIRLNVNEDKPHYLRHVLRFKWCKSRP